MFIKTQALATKSVLMALSTLVLFMAGCGSSDGVDKYQLKGSVSYDGVPIKQGFVNFKAIDGQSPTATFAVKNGVFSGLTTLGTKRVEIYSEIEVPGEFGTTEFGEKVQLTKSLPAKHNEQSELTIEMKNDVTQNNFEFKLEK